MLAGELYDARDPELVADRLRCERLQSQFNTAASEEERVRLLGDWLGGVGEDAFVRPPFFCDYGFNISLGAGVFLNFNCVILDVARVTIGAKTQVGSAVQILTADHPRDPQTRRTGAETGIPITIGENVWIGSGAIICPGVTIGDDAIVGAGAVVTRDVAAGATAVGNPARARGV